MTAAIEANTSVRIANHGNTRFKGWFNKRNHFIDPGSEVIMPWGAAVAWLGDPTAVDQPDKRRFERREERRRINILWGGQPPQLVVHDVSGEHIPMLVDDPDGLSVTPAGLTLSDSEAIEGRIAEMERQINGLKKKQMRTQRKEQAGEEAPEDGPTKVPVSG